MKIKNLTSLPYVSHYLFHISLKIYSYVCGCNRHHMIILWLLFCVIYSISVMTIYVGLYRYCVILYEIQFYLNHFSFMMRIIIYVITFVANIQKINDLRDNNNFNVWYCEIFLAMLNSATFGNMCKFSLYYQPLCILI